MSGTKLNVQITKEDFLKLSGAEQNALIYSCLCETQVKIDFKWKRLVAIGATAGFVGGFFHNMISKITGLSNI